MRQAQGATMKTAIFLSIALALPGAVLASPPGSADAQRDIYTYALDLDAQGRIEAVAPHGFVPDATGTALAQDIRGWTFRAGEAGDTRTYLRVVVDRPADAGQGYRVVSATTGPAPEQLTQPEYPMRDQLSDHQGMVVLKLEVGADGAVSGADVHATSGNVSRAMASRAADAARGWTFTPEQVDGQPVAATMLWPVCYLGAQASASECSWNGPDAQRFSSRSVLPLDANVTLVSSTR